MLSLSALFDCVARTSTEQAILEVSHDPCRPLSSSPGIHERAKGFQVKLRRGHQARSGIMLHLGPVLVSEARDTKRLDVPYRKLRKCPSRIGCRAR